MDIAAFSMLNSQTQVMTNVNTALLSMSLDTIKTSGDNMVKLMESSVTPNLGQNIDIKL